MHLCHVIYIFQLKFLSDYVCIITITLYDFTCLKYIHKIKDTSCDIFSVGLHPIASLTYNWQLQSDQAIIIAYIAVIFINVLLVERVINAIRNRLDLTALSIAVIFLAIL